MATWFRGMVRVAAVWICVLFTAGGTVAHADATPALSFEVTASMALATGEESLVEGWFRLTHAPPKETLGDIAVVVDISRLDGVAEVTSSSGGEPCDIQGETATCFGDADFHVHDGLLRIGLFHLRGVDGVQPGTEVPVPVTVTTDNFPDVAATLTLTKAESADLGNGEAYPIWVKPGELRGVNVSVRNVGDTVVDGAVLVLRTPWQLRMERRFRNCSYGEAVAVCRFHSELSPHTVHEVTGTLAFTVENYAVAPSQTSVSASWYTLETYLDTVRPGLPRLTRGSGPRLRLVEITMANRVPEHDTKVWNHVGIYNVFITGNNPVDFAAVGGSFSGVAGNIADVEIGLRNAGRAYADNEDSDKPSVYADVRLPKGVSLAADPPCGLREPGVYRCALTLDSMPRDRHLWRFRVRIDERVPDATGSVTVVDGTVHDGGLGNNTARITANPSAAPSPSGSPSGSPAPSGTVTPSGSAVPSGSVVPSGSGGPGSMPVTGFRLGALLTVGLLALLVGGFLFLVAKRRRPGRPAGEM